jgi:hypothetical protein
MANFLWDFLRIFDKFERYTGLTRKGQGRTWVGTLATIVILMIVLAYLIVLITQPIKLESITKTTETPGPACPDRRNLATTTPSTVTFTSTLKTRISEIHDPVYNDSTVYNLTDSQFMIAFKWNDGVYDNATMVIEGNIIKNLDSPTIEIIDFEPCTTSHFPSTLETHLLAIDITKYMCVASANMNIMGNSMYGNSHVLYFHVSKCYSGSCNSDLFTPIYQKYVDVVYTEWIYARDNLANPIKVVLNTDKRVLIDPYDVAHTFMEVHPNLVEYEDGSSSRFYSLEDVNYSFVYNIDDIRLATFTISLSDSYKRYTQYTYKQPDINSGTLRRALTTTVTEKKETEKMSAPLLIFYILSQLGGLYSFLLLIVGFFIYPFVTRALTNDTIIELNEANEREIKKLNLLSN